MKAALAGKQEGLTVRKESMYSQICPKLSPRGPNISGHLGQIFFNRKCAAEGQTPSGRITQMTIKSKIKADDCYC
jgi:hypothetical protein